MFFLSSADIFFTIKSIFFKNLGPKNENVTEWGKSMPASSRFCCLLIIFTNNLDPV